MAEGRRSKDVAELAGVSLPTVDRWVARYAEQGLAGVQESSHAAPRGEGPGWGRGRVPALARCASREMSGYLKRVEGVAVSWHYVANLWRDNGLQPHRQGTFKLSKD